MRVELKPGVSLRGVQPPVVLACIAVAGAYAALGKTCTITSVTEGRHGTGSKHYIGNAVDFRTRHLDDSETRNLAAMVRSALGAEFDVVLEPTHLHIEFDPKSPLSA